jgi:hypothetical protein
MVLSDAAWGGSSGAIGIAWDAETAAKPSPIANADAASIFINAPFCCTFAPPKLDDVAVTSSDGASGGDASAGASPNACGASPSDGGASADASGGPSAPPVAEDDRLRFGW